MAAVAGFPKLVVIVLAHAIKHLQRFNIADLLVETQFFQKFTTRVHMLLNGNTSANLWESFVCFTRCTYRHFCREIYRNQTDYSTKGSLIWILDRTKTKFGARMLKNWVGRPLVDMAWVVCFYPRWSVIICKSGYSETE
jgi:DNA mismatch repair protein MSH3